MGRVGCTNQGDEQCCKSDWHGPFPTLGIMGSDSALSTKAEWSRIDIHGRKQSESHRIPSEMRYYVTYIVRSIGEEGTVECLTTLVIGNMFQ